MSSTKSAGLLRKANLIKAGKKSEDKTLNKIEAEQKPNNLTDPDENKRSNSFFNTDSGEPFMAAPHIDMSSSTDKTPTEKTDASTSSSKKKSKNKLSSGQLTGSKPKGQDTAWSIK